VHPSGDGGRHELYLMCDDIEATLAGLAAKGTKIAREVTDQSWALLAAIRLPDGSEFPLTSPGTARPAGTDGHRLTVKYN
jgi:predicted enzyme related to lactoylglutathione lyase